MSINIGSELPSQSRGVRAFDASPHRQAGRESEWPPIDVAVLQDRVTPVPAFPLDMLPAAWCDWIGDTARAVGAPVDYVAQAVLGAVAGLSGKAVRVSISEVWQEPLALWLALIGPPSSGKTSALTSVRRLIDGLEGTDSEPKPHVISSPCTLDAVAKIAGENQRGVMLWRDEPSAALALLGAGRASGELTTMPVNVLCSLEPDRLVETLRHGGDRLAARLLYAWPQQAAYCPLSDRKPARNNEASSMLRRLLRQPGSAAYPLVLAFDESGVHALDRFLERLHAHLPETEGLEAAWIGKGGGTVARLAGVLELLDWSATQSPSPSPIGAERVECAAALWLDYFAPHARAFLDRAAPTDMERRARRVVRWLRATGAQQVSREDIRRHALGRTVDAAGAEAVLSRLTGAGVVNCLPLVISAEGGRPAWRWEVNPALAAAAPS